MPAPTDDFARVVLDEFGRRDRMRRRSVAFGLAVVTVAVFGVIYCAAVDGGRGAAVDKRAIAQTVAFSKAMWIAHNCAAANQESTVSWLCHPEDWRALTAGTTIALKKPHIIHHCQLGHSAALAETLPNVPSGDCVEYALSDGNVLTYALAKTSNGWKIVTWAIDNPNA